MQDNPRHFEVSDPFGRSWKVELQWFQNGISIRHADTIDVKYRLTSPEQVMEKVIALPHVSLLDVSRRAGRAVTDPWTVRLAGHHLMHMIENWSDMEKHLVTLRTPEVQEVADEVAAEQAA